MDLRYSKLAKILIDYSTKTKKGDKVLIEMSEPESLVLVKEVYKQAVLKGAHAEVCFSSASFGQDLFKLGSDEQIKHYSQFKDFGIKWADVWLAIRAVKNPYELKGIDSRKVAQRQKIYAKLNQKRIEKCRWVLCWVPTEAFAQQAQLPLDKAVDFFFKATLKDWSEEVKKYRKIQKIFQKGSQVRIVGKDTEISFSTEKRRYVIGDGAYNMPDGEIFTAPIKSSVEGKIYFDVPTVRGGEMVKDVYLEFKKGKAVKARAKQGQKQLESALATDAGAEYVGEFGIGVNYGIRTWTLDTLFDEKIGGSIHLALGNAYKECGGKNKSGLHWDLIKDLRKQGEIYVDNKKVFARGRFLI